MSLGQLALEVHSTHQLEVQIGVEPLQVLEFHHIHTPELLHESVPLQEIPSLQVLDVSTGFEQTPLLIVQISSVHGLLSLHWELAVHQVAVHTHDIHTCHDGHDPVLQDPQHPSFPQQVTHVQSGTHWHDQLIH